MKTHRLLALAIAAALSPVAAQAQAIDESSRFIDIGIGVGASESTGETLGMFTQRIAAEWIVKDDIFNLGRHGFALGVGFQIDNAVGGRYSSIVDGKYDYTYTRYTTYYRKDNGHGRPGSETKFEQVRRKGSGLATADVVRDNISLMPTVSLHGKFFEKLDLYATFGAGLGIQTYSLSGFEPTEVYVPGVGTVGGMEKKSYHHEADMPYGSMTVRYDYNDADHAEWNKKPYKAKATFACALFVGARYFLNSDWALNAQFGLVSANVRRVNGTSLNSYNILSVGATYSF